MLTGHKCHFRQQERHQGSVGYTYPIFFGQCLLINYFANYSLKLGFAKLALGPDIAARFPVYTELCVLSYCSH